MIAIMPQGGMLSEAKNCKNFTSIGESTSASLSLGGYLIVGIGAQTATVKIPMSMSAYVIVLGDSSPSIGIESSVSVTLDENGVAWN